MFDILKTGWTLINVAVLLLIIGVFIQCIRWLYELVQLNRSNHKILGQILEELRKR